MVAPVPIASVVSLSVIIVAWVAVTTCGTTISGTRTLLSFLSLLLVGCHHCWLTVLGSTRVSITLIFNLRLRRLGVASLWISWQLVSSLLHLSLFYVDSSSVNLSDRVVPNEIFSDVFFTETNKAKASRLPSINVFENDCVNNFSKLTKMFFQLFICQFKVESANKNFRLGIGELDGVFGVQ